MNGILRSAYLWSLPSKQAVQLFQPEQICLWQRWNNQPDECNHGGRRDPITRERVQSSRARCGLRLLLLCKHLVESDFQHHALMFSCTCYRSCVFLPLHDEKGL
jgi:hypothetical protein